MTTPFRVALVCMPFAAATRPSIQISLLKTILEQSGHYAETFHLNVELATKIGLDDYKLLCDHRGHMTGEWLCSIAAFGESVLQSDQEYLDAFPNDLAWIRAHGKPDDFLTNLRHHVIPSYISSCLSSYHWGSYQLVAFSSTFQQNVASLALAKQIKEVFPHVLIAFGGANMEGEMGPAYLEAFKCIDYVMSGEGDLLFPALVAELKKGVLTPPLPGLSYRTSQGIVTHHPAEPIADLNSLPTPNYDEYFERMTRHHFLDHIAPIPFESSRGCWWGQRSHCTFCGLNGSSLAYRSKKPERVLDELTALARRYRINSFEAVDNILDTNYLEGVFKPLQDLKTDYHFFFEIKAELSFEQVKTLYLGGVRAVQPGIESLNTHLLKLMKKGTSMLLNLRTLKWCQYYGIHVAWNLLFGFPGETLEDYDEQLRVIKMIPHLPPPSGCGRLWMERFSPYFVRRDEYGVVGLSPEASYFHAYPKYVDLNKTAYFFEYQMPGTLADADYSMTHECVQNWKNVWKDSSQPKLTYRRNMDSIFIDDQRSSAGGVSHAIDGAMAEIYEFCTPSYYSVHQVYKFLQERDYQCSAIEVKAALDSFCDRELMVQEKGRYFSLALPENPNW
jgi:ribosomal peptide maturation radical SAM protein 1